MISCVGPKPTLLERNANQPPLDALVEEADVAVGIVSECSREA